MKPFDEILPVTKKATSSKNIIRVLIKSTKKPHESKPYKTFNTYINAAGGKMLNIDYVE